MKGEICDLYQGRGRRKMITTIEGAGKQGLSIDGEKVLMARSMQKPVELSGIQAEQARLGSLGSLLGDWRQDYREVKVLYRLDVFGEETFVVRTVPHIGFASTKYVGVKSGLLRAEDRITVLPGMGQMGV